VTVDGQGLSRDFQIDSGVTANITGLTITGGSATYGAGLEVKGTVTLTNCTITRNYGGGIQVEPGASARLYSTTVFNNSSAAGGGICDKGTVTLTGCTVWQNQGNQGAGLYTGPSATATLTDCTVSGNIGLGDGLYIGAGATATLTGCTVSGNVGTHPGAGLYIGAGATATLTNCTVSENSEFTNGGFAPTNGGGLYIGLRAIATLTDCTVSGNSSTNNGGGFFNDGTAKLTNCTISGNTGNQGGGIYAPTAGKTHLYSCTLTGNSAVVDGGGLNNGGITNGAIAKLYGCTVAGNTAESGGGIYNYSGTTSLDGTIVAGNTATATNGFSDIEADSRDDQNESLAVSGEYSLIGLGVHGNVLFSSLANDIILTTTTEYTPANPAGLAPLADYGGPAQTMALVAGSPARSALHASDAIDIGTLTDERGFARPTTNLDIGAFQTQSSYALVVQTTDDDGAPATEFDLRGAIDMANIQGGSQTVTFSPTVFATAQTITLTQGPLELSGPSRN
jgi:hypothetical protein